MKANEIKVGEKYIAKISGKLVIVSVDVIRENYANRTRYDVTNLTTGRKTTFHSAAKFRRKVAVPASDGALCRCPYKNCRFTGTENAVDEHRTTHAHDDQPQAGSNIRI